MHIVRLSLTWRRAWSFRRPRGWARASRTVDRSRSRCLASTFKQIEDEGERTMRTDLWMSLPSMMISPDVGRRSLINIRKVVVLPAPLAPARAISRYEETEREGSDQEDRSRIVVWCGSWDGRRQCRCGCRLVCFWVSWIAERDRERGWLQMLLMGRLARWVDVRFEHLDRDARREANEDEKDRKGENVRNHPMMLLVFPCHDLKTFQCAFLLTDCHSHNNVAIVI